MRFRMVPEQKGDEVPEGSGQFRGRKLMRFRRALDFSFYRFRIKISWLVLQFGCLCHVLAFGGWPIACA